MASNTSTPLTDTSPESERILIEGYRRMEGWERIERVRALNRLVCALALSDIARKHPQADERERLLRLASRRMDPAILRSLCGWDVSEHGY